MDWLSVVIIFIIGFALGIAAAFVLKIIQSRAGKELARELFEESEARRKEAVDGVIENVKDSFGSLSLEALAKSTDEFLKLAREKFSSEREINIKELDQKKSLIDQQLEKMTGELNKVTDVVKELEKDRVEKFGELASQLKETNEKTSLLTQTTNRLNEALASSKARGQWGERMAEDVLRLAGFIEGVNYIKQRAIEGIGSRPDFTFQLPQGLKLNMDVKFPLDNYVKYLDAESDLEKDKFCKDFLKDVKARISEVKGREYINPEQNTVDYVLLFIPNEQIYAFIHEQDSSIMDEGIKNKVVFCSPITLFAVLAVIRQAVDNFALERTSNEILSLLGTFRKQWEKFLEKLESLGKRIEDAQKDYESLITTRKRQLDKPLQEIENLRTERGLPIEEPETSQISQSDE